MASEFPRRPPPPRRGSRPGAPAGAATRRRDRTVRRHGSLSVAVAGRHAGPVGREGRLHAGRSRDRSDREQAWLRRRPAPRGMGDPRAAQGRGPGAGQQRRIPDGAVRDPSARFLSQRHLCGRPRRGGLRPDAAAREREPTAGPVADVRHRLPPPAVRAQRLRPGLRPHHRAPQRRAGAGQHDHHGRDGTRPAGALRAASRPAATDAAGPREPGALPGDLDQGVAPVRSHSMRRPTFVLTLASVLAAPCLTAQVPASARDMLRRLFASRDFAPQRFGPARWIDGGAAYTTVEPSADPRGGSDIVRYETATRARTGAGMARQLLPASRPAPPQIDDYAWSADGAHLLVFTNTRRVWRQNTRGDYWVLDRPSGSL